MNKKITTSILFTASFINVSMAKADLFLHSNFDIAPGQYNDFITIPDLTGNSPGVGFGNFLSGSLAHPSSPGSSGNRITGYTSIGYSGISSQFNQEWYGSYICRMETGLGGGISMRLDTGNQNTSIFHDFVSDGCSIRYNGNNMYHVTDVAIHASHFLLMHYVPSSSNGPGLFEIWLNPDIANLSAPSLSYSIATTQPLNGIYMTHWLGQNDGSMDELRFGTELSDVAVVPSTATLAPLLGLAMAHRRRR